MEDTTYVLKNHMHFRNIIHSQFWSIYNTIIYIVKITLYEIINKSF